MTYVIRTTGAVTVTVAVLVTLPPAPVAINVYVVVVAGETLCDPLGTDSLGTDAPFSVAVVAFDVVHDSVAELPLTIDEGDANSDAVGIGGGGGGGGGAAVTVTVAVLVTLPPAPVAINSYVVVAVGETLCEPLTDTASFSVPPFSVTVVAFDVVHDSVAELPLTISVGDAVSVAVGIGDVGGAAVTVTVARLVTLVVPPEMPLPSLVATSS